MRNLVVLWQIGIEVLLAVELAVLSNVEIQSHRRFHGVFEHLLIEYWQRPGQPTHHRINVGVGVIAEGGRGRREDLAVRPQLHMGFQADHGFPGRLGCCVGHHGIT